MHTCRYPPFKRTQLQILQSMFSSDYTHSKNKTNRILKNAICFQRYNLSSFLFVTATRRRTLFYESSLAFTYHSNNLACQDTLKVVCTVGKTVKTVVDYKACPVSEG